MRNLAVYATTAIAGAAMLAIPATSASAFTLSGPSLKPAVNSAQIDKVWYRRWGRGYGWHGYGWRGYGWRGYGWGRHCWRGYWGRLHCN